MIRLVMRKGRYIGSIAVKAGAIHILKNQDGEEVVTGYSWEGLLFNTAKLFV